MKKFVKGVFLGAIVPLGMCGFAFTVYQASKKKYEELEEKEREKQKEWEECLNSLEKLMEDIESQKARKIREGLLKDIKEYGADLDKIYESEHIEYAIPYEELIMKHTN